MVSQHLGMISTTRSVIYNQSSYPGVWRLRYVYRSLVSGQSANRDIAEGIIRTRSLFAQRS